LIASLIKVVAAPAIGFLLAGLFNLDTTERMVAIFYLASPAAGMSYVMAEVMGNDGPLAGRIVALSTLLSAITSKFPAQSSTFIMIRFENITLQVHRQAGFAGAARSYR